MSIIVNKSERNNVIIEYEIIEGFPITAPVSKFSLKTPAYPPIIIVKDASRTERLIPSKMPIIIKAYSK
jgi:hypothetical protein